MERTQPTTDDKPGRKAQVRKRMARALFANYIHEVSGRHRATDDRPTTGPSGEPASATVD